MEKTEVKISKIKTMSLLKIWAICFVISFVELIICFMLFHEVKIFEYSYGRYILNGPFTPGYPEFGGYVYDFDPPNFYDKMFRFYIPAAFLLNTLPIKIVFTIINFIIYKVVKKYKLKIE